VSTIDKTLFCSMVHESFAGIYGKLIEYAFREAIGGEAAGATIQLLTSLEGGSGEDGGSDILDQICSCDLYVADITPVLALGTKRFPGPGVMYELGFAVSELGWGCIALIQNEHFGPTPALPFPLDDKRLLRFSFDPDGENAQQQTAELISGIRSELLEPLGASDAPVVEQEPQVGAVSVEVTPVVPTEPAPAVSPDEPAPEKSGDGSSQVVSLEIEVEPGQAGLDLSGPLDLSLDGPLELDRPDQPGIPEPPVRSSPAPVPQDAVELVEIALPPPAPHREEELSPINLVFEAPDDLEMPQQAPALEVKASASPPERANPVPALEVEESAPVLVVAASTPAPAQEEPAPTLDVEVKTPAPVEVASAPTPEPTEPELITLEDDEADEEPEPEPELEAAPEPAPADPTEALFALRPPAKSAPLIEQSNSTIKQDMVLLNYRMQLFTRQDPLVRKIRSRGYWVLTFFPTPLLEERPEPADLVEIIQDTTVKTAGENYPLYFSGEAPRCHTDRAEQDYEVGATRCAWRQFTDGMYVSFMALPNDWMTNPETWDFGYDDEDEPARVFYPSEALRELARFFDFISRHAESPLGSQSALYFVRAACIALQDRPLVEDLEMFKYPRVMTTQEQVFDWNQRLPIEALASPKLLTLRLMSELLGLFGYRPGYEVLTEAYDKITSR